MLELKEIRPVRLTRDAKILSLTLHDKSLTRVSFLVDIANHLNRHIRELFEPTFGLRLHMMLQTNKIIGINSFVAGDTLNRYSKVSNML